VALLQRGQRRADDARSRGKNLAAFLWTEDVAAALESGPWTAQGCERRRRDATGIVALADPRRSPRSAWCEM
jgi:hypothetical protein